MPQRFLKPGIISSKKWDSCSWIAQSFYIRLLTLVDDFGRYEAEYMLLKSMAFPLREDIRASQVQKLCDELQANQLVNFYSVDGKSYLEITNWTERHRSEQSKHPASNNGILRNPAESCGPLPSKSSPSSSSKPSSSSSDKTLPQLGDVERQGLAIGLPEIECEKFFNYYEANGWRVGKNPMKQWKSALANWKQHWIEYGGNETQNGQPPKAKTIFEKRAVITAKETLAAQIKNKHCTEGPVGNDWNDQGAKQQYITLRKEIKKLNIEISNMA